MNNEEFLKLVQDTPSVQYTYNKGHLFIIATITQVKHNYLIFNDGQIGLYDNTKVVEYSRPSNIIIECDWCYSIVEDGEHLGFVYKRKV